MILRQLGANRGRDDPISHRVCLTGEASNRIQGEEDFLLQIAAKLSDPTFRIEKVGPDNFWLGLLSSRVPFSLAQLYVW